MGRSPCVPTGCSRWAWPPKITSAPASTSRRPSTDVVRACGWVSSSTPQWIATITRSASFFAAAVGPRPCASQIVAVGGPRDGPGPPPRSGIRVDHLVEPDDRDRPPVPARTWPARSRRRGPCRRRSARSRSPAGSFACPAARSDRSRTRGCCRGSPRRRRRSASPGAQRGRPGVVRLPGDLRPERDTAHSQFTIERSSRWNIPCIPVHACSYPCVRKAGMTLGSRFVSPPPWMTRACRDGDGVGVEVATVDGARDAGQRRRGGSRARCADSADDRPAMPASPAATTAPHHGRGTSAGSSAGRCRPFTVGTLRPRRRRWPGSVRRRRAICSASAPADSNRSSSRSRAQNSTLDGLVSKVALEVQQEGLDVQRLLAERGVRPDVDGGGVGARRRTSPGRRRRPRRGGACGRGPRGSPSGSPARRPGPRPRTTRPSTANRRPSASVGPFRSPAARASRIEVDEHRRAPRGAGATPPPPRTLAPRRARPGARASPRPDGRT